jgi:hypothetical protein
LTHRSSGLYTDRYSSGEPQGRRPMKYAID